MKSLQASKLFGVALAVVMVIVFWTLFGGGAPTGSPTVEAHPVDWANQSGTVSSAKLDGLLREVRVIQTRPSIAGYDRGCGKEHACSFGPAWTDDYTGVAGHDGCDTRNNVLQRDLLGVKFRSGTHNCVVLAGILQDPYTGRTIQFAKANASAVQVDHVYALSLAFDMGAWQWPLEKRIRFANDLQRNLIVVDGPTNASKGDRSLAEWMPPNKAFRCEYLVLFLQVANAYDLPITVADRDYVASAGLRCNHQER